MREVEEDTFEHIHVVPPEPIPEPIPEPDTEPVQDPASAREPVAYLWEGRLHIEEGGTIPLESCVCCGRRTSRTIEKSLRNPRNPLTWFGDTRKVELGLCRKHADNNNIGIALTWSLLVVGLLVLGTGIATVTISAMIVGVFSTVLSGIFRAAMPVSAVDPRAEVVELRGVASRYLENMGE